MRYLELLNERISLAVDYKPIYDHLVYIIENIPELENIDEIDYDPKSFHQLMAYVVEHLFAFLNQYIRKYISISTQCIWDIGEIIHLPTLGAYYPDKDAIVINIEPLLFYFDAYLNKSSTHQNFRSGYRKYLKSLIRTFFHELTHAIQMHRAYERNPKNIHKANTSLSKSKMHYKHEKADYDDYLTQHAEIEAFVKTFLHTIIFKEAKRLKNLSGPALQQKIKEIIAKVIPAAYKKFKGTKSESIYRTVVKKLYMDTMEYLDSLKNP